METATVLPKNLTKEESEMLKKRPQKLYLNGNYIILLAVILFCGLLVFLGFPLWSILSFGIGMITILLLLYALRGFR